MSFWEKLFKFWNQTLVLQKHVLWMTITPKHIHYSQEILILLPQFNVVQYLAQNTFHYIKNFETRLIRQRKLIRVTQNTLSLTFKWQKSFDQSCHALAFIEIFHFYIRSQTDTTREPTIFLNLKVLLPHQFYLQIRCFTFLNSILAIF